MEIDYVNLTADEIARDPDFRQWILQPSPGANHFWQRFLLLYPQQKDKVLLARNIVILADRISGVHLDPARKTEIHSQLIGKIEKSRKHKAKVKFLFSMAAVSIVLIAIISLTWIKINRPGDGLIYSADFGQRQKIELPDGSRVDLNANSTLKLGDQWDQGIREVWLEGEAYFEVEKNLSNVVKFTVHTNGPDIEVVGTRFNVNSRKEETNIFLEEGKVCLILNDMEKGRKEVFLDPGELAYFRKNHHHISKQDSKQVESLISWKTGYLVYEDTSLSEVIDDIKFTYGREVKVIDSDLLSRKINGAVPTNDLNEFIKVTELLFSVHAEIRGSQIILKKN